MKKNLIVTCLLIAFACMSGCKELIPKATELPSYYLLDGNKQSTEPESSQGKNPQASESTNRLSQATLVVNPSTAVAGFTSTRMIYSRVPYKLEYFAHRQWVDTPARMLTPLILNTLKAKSLFNSVTLSPNSAKSRYSLDTKIIRLQQDFFSPQSTERFTLWVTLIDNLKHEVILVREFNAVVTTKNDNPYGGVVAANEAVQIVLEQLAAQCNEVLLNRK